MTRRIGILLCSAVFGIGGCSSTHSATSQPSELVAAPVGQICVVILRADALGYTGSSDNTDEESPPTEDAIPSYLQGRLVQLNTQWVVLRDKEGHLFYIPRESVLAVSVEEKRKT